MNTILFFISYRPFSFRNLLLSDLSIFKFHLSCRIISQWRYSQTRSAQYFKTVDLRIFLSYLCLYYESQSTLKKRNQNMPEVQIFLSRNWEEILFCSVRLILLITGNLMPLCISIQANIIGRRPNKYFLFMDQTV